MSHEIHEGWDVQQGTQMAWHGLTEVWEQIDLNSPKCALRVWDVRKEPMINPDGTVSEWCRLACTDDPPKYIGAPVHVESYGLVKNADFLATAYKAIQEIRQARVESVGSVCKRARIFVSISLKDLPSFEAAGREFKPYLNFLSSHDKSAPFIINMSNICTVCNNTFSANLSLGGMNVSSRLKHSKNVSDKLDNVSQIVAAFLGAQDAFRKKMDEFAKVAINEEAARLFFIGWLAEDAKSLSTRRLNQAERLTGLFRGGAGNKGQNLADVFSAITDYYSHESSGGDEDRMKQYLSSEFGDGQTAKLRAFADLSDPELVQEAIDSGRKLLEQYKEDQKV